MKLKHWLVILLLLNAAALAWQWDVLARWGWGPNVHREPERLQKQIRPEALVVRPLGQRLSASTAPAEVTADAPVLPASGAAVPMPPASAASASAAAAANGVPTPTR